MEISLSYAAGIIDGEGTITLSRMRKTDKWRTPIVSVSSTTIELLNALVAAFGGHICKHKVYKSHHKQSFSWRVEGRKAISLCQELKPYLLVPSKQYRAKLIATDYVTCTPRNGKYTETLTRKKQQFENEFFHPSKP